MDEPDINLPDNTSNTIKTMKTGLTGLTGTRTRIVHKGSGYIQ
jgi:hypothetical protein